MYIATVPNRSSPPAILLRESWREGRHVRTRTLANLSHWPAPKIEALRRVLRDEPVILACDIFTIQRSLPHGHVLAVLGTLRRLGLERLIASVPSPQRTLVLAMIVARVIDPRSKLATARGLDRETASSSLGRMLGLETADADDLYDAMDWLVKRQPRIEAKLAQKHLEDGSLVLYDVSSVWYEGHTCPLVKFGHSRDGRRDKPQIIFGLLCNAQGCPVAIEVFEGNTADPKTLPHQIEKLRQRFGLKRVVLVGDRGMITAARIRDDLRPIEGLDWITTLRAPAIRALAEQKLIQLSLFDQRDLAEIQSPDYPNERLIACRNPLLADERRRKREALMQATQKLLDAIVAATQRVRRPLTGASAIGLRVGKVLSRYKVAKYFTCEITDTSFGYVRNPETIAVDAGIDGIYVIRTRVPAERLEAAAAVRAYKRLSTVERAIRSFKTVDLKVRPIHHRLEERVRAHVFLCMLAYYVEWHLRQALASILFDDDDPAGAATRRGSVVQPAMRSESAEHKAATRRTAPAAGAASQEPRALGAAQPLGAAGDSEKAAGTLAGLPVHSFRTLLEDLKTLTRNAVRFHPDNKTSVNIKPATADACAAAMEVLATPTPLQHRVFQLLQVPVTL